MKIRIRDAHALAALAAGAVLAASSLAAAQQACEDNTYYPNRVYIAGSSASKPVLQALAQVLQAKKIPISILYQSPDSCIGVNDLLTSTAETTAAAPSYFGYNDNGVTPPSSCTVSAIDGGILPPVDIAVSDVFADTCFANNLTSSGLTSGQKEVLGPIQAMAFAAPVLSSATAISAEAAYVVFGYDAATYSVPPWIQPSNIFVRADSSGTENMIGTAIGLIAPKWANANPAMMNNQQQASTGAMEAAVGNVTSNQSATIGILSAEAIAQYNAAATSANKLKTLAYQHTGQSCGYLPDSTATAIDKINVRQGRYAIWGPLHFFVNVDANGNPLGGGGNTDPSKIAAISAILNYFIATGPTPTQTFTIAGSLNPPVDGGAITLTDGGLGGSLVVGDDDKQALIAAEATPAFVVPWCAMQVSRSAELGAESSYQPPEPCGCYYESLLGATNSNYCTKTCSTNADCTTGPYGTCRYGYCEVQ